MMKILGINGSPRKGGNTEIMLTQILKEAESLGAESEYLAVDKLNFQGCKGCLWCQHTGSARCVQQDDMAGIYEKIANADAIIVGTPVYFSGMTGQLKTFMDRLYPFYGRGGIPSRLPKKIKLALLITQGQADPQLYTRSFEIAASAFRLIGFEVLDTNFFIPGAVEKGDVLKDPSSLEQAKLLSKQLFYGKV